jgi:hypothetical protein
MSPERITSTKFDGEATMPRPQPTAPDRANDNEPFVSEVRIISMSSDNLS